MAEGGLSSSDEETSYSDFMFKGSTVALIGIVVTGALGMLIRMLLSRGLSPSEYGAFYAIFSFLSFLSIFRELGLGASIKRFTPEFIEDKDFTGLKSSIFSSFLVQIAVSLTVLGLVSFFSGGISVWLTGSESAAPLVVMIGSWFVLMVFTSTGKSVFASFKDITRSRVLGIVRMSATFVAAIVASYFYDLDPTATALAFIIGGITSGLFLFIELFRSQSGVFSKGELKISSSITKKMLLFGLPLMAAGLAGTITSRVDTIVISTFRTSTEVGYYQVARPITKLIKQIGTVAAAPLFPLVSELWAKDNMEKLESTTYYVLKFSIMLVIPLALVFFSFPKIAIRVLFRPEYIPAATAVRILSLTMIATSMFSLLGNILVATGKNVLYSKIFGLAAVLNVGGDIVLVPIVGMEGAATAFLSSFLVAVVVEIYYLGDYIEFPLPLADSGKIIAGGVLSLVWILFLRTVLPLPVWPETAVIVVLVGFFYLTWVLNADVLKARDARIIRETVPIPSQIYDILKKLRMAG